MDESHLVTGTVLRSVDFSTQDRIERLESEVATLRATVNKLCAELGIDAPTPKNQAVLLRAI